MNAVVTKSGGVYTFEIDEFSQNYDIYVSDHHNFSDEVFLATSSDDIFAIASPNNSRLFFRITDNAGNTAYTATKLVEDVGITNFRDLGGYANADGQKVRWGTLYRGAGLSGLTNQNQQDLLQMGLKTIFDFRSLPEVSAHPDIVPTGINYINRSGIVTMDRPSDPLNNEDKFGNLDMVSMVIKAHENPELLSELDDYLANAYCTMAENSDAFKVLFQNLLNAPASPLVFHCSAGKDRTGIAAALILSLLKVPKDTVLSDYLLSNFYRWEENERTLDKVRARTDNPEIIEIVNHMIQNQPSLLTNYFQRIDELYGNLDDFYKTALGLSSSDISALQSAYLLG